MHISTLTAFGATKPAIWPGRTVIRLGLVLALCAAAATSVVRLSTIVSPASVPALDGRYAGVATPAFEGRNGECASLAALSDLVIVGEHASMAGGVAVLRGRLYKGGALTLSGAMGGPATLTGRFEGARFTGELRSWNCTYALALSRRS
ncbi:hypothetical protein [Falsiroseomonas sp. E2-1-a20]|uniref:hypothetical protein n=1 Tax=Falsiroseomonas sp. E2-1-a20 TaxID=3239300 RepID=UPI003F318481